MRYLLCTTRQILEQVLHACDDINDYWTGIVAWRKWLPRSDAYF